MLLKRKGPIAYSFSYLVDFIEDLVFAKNHFEMIQ